MVDGEEKKANDSNPEDDKGTPVEGEVVNPSQVITTIRCPNCGQTNPSDAAFCSKCGSRLHSNGSANDDEPVRCPNCGSTQIEFVTYQGGQSFDTGSACCGYACVGPLGLLCGVKDKGPARTVWKCKKCGHEF
jgi:DNA-directed RNA polymerase subunit RPC12/RpoP